MKTTLGDTVFGMLYYAHPMAIEINKNPGEFADQPPVEQLDAKEITTEQEPVELPDSLESSEESSETTAPAQQPQQQTPTSRPQVTVTTADELTRRVEKIMEQDLGDTFSHLSPLAKQEFKIKGEKTARAIRTLLSKTTLKVKKVFELIVAWLKLLPGVNRFFLEQEAKIKTDRIIELHSEYR
jgi:hypothetical protein